MPKPFLRILIIIVLILSISSSAHCSVIDSIKYLTQQSSNLAENAASKIIEKANEYGYDDIDIIVRYSMQIKYPEGIEVKELDASLALLDLALVATQKGIGYINFLFRNRLSNLMINYIPYLTGQNSLTNLIIYNVKSEIKNYLEQYNLGLFLDPDSSSRNKNIIDDSQDIPENITLPELNTNVEQDRKNISILQKGSRYFNASLSQEMYEKIEDFFPKNTLPSKLMKDLSSGQILYAIVNLLNQYKNEFNKINTTLEDGAKFIRVMEKNIKSSSSFKIIMSIPSSINEMKKITEFIEEIPESATNIANHGSRYYKLIKDLNKKEYMNILPLGENIFKIHDTFGDNGIKFITIYSVNGADFLFRIKTPSSYMKKRIRMLNFLNTNGYSAVSWLFKLKLLSPLEPIITGIFFFLFIFVILYFHISGYLVYSEFSILPLRQKFAIILILILFFGSLYWALVENAKFLIETKIKQKQIVYEKLPEFNLSPSTFFATSINAIESTEIEFNKKIRLGFHYRTAEIKLFQQNLSNLKSKYIVNIDSFEVRLISEPKLYTNYSSEKIITEKDLLLDLTLSIKNLDNTSMIFPLIIELSSVMGNRISPVQGHQRLSKTTFNPGVKDIFTLTFPVRLEDRPDRIVVKKEFLIQSKESFIDFGPGTPFRTGDLFPTRNGLIYIDNLKQTMTEEITLEINILSSFDTTKEISILKKENLKNDLFLVTKEKKTIYASDIKGDFPYFPEIAPNNIHKVNFIFDIKGFKFSDIAYLVMNNKKILPQKYVNHEKGKKLVLYYLNRIAAAAEFEQGMYYLNPPIYRRWARDMSEARTHFLKALKLLPDFEIIKNAVELTKQNNK